MCELKGRDAIRLMMYSLSEEDWKIEPCARFSSRRRLVGVHDVWRFMRNRQSPPMATSPEERLQRRGSASPPWPERLGRSATMGRCPISPGKVFITLGRGEADCPAPGRSGGRGRGKVAVLGGTFGSRDPASSCARCECRACRPGGATEISPVSAAPMTTEHGLHSRAAFFVIEGGRTGDRGGHPCLEAEFLRC